MTKRILITAATAAEIQPFIEAHPFKKLPESELLSTQINTLRVDVLITGIGLVATTYALTRLLSESNYAVVLNVGICGALDSALSLESLVHVISDCMPEIGYDSPLGIQPLKLPAGMAPVVTEIHNAFEYSCEVIKNIPRVKGVSVQTVTGTYEKATCLRNAFGASVESMEGFAFLSVCNWFGQTCVQLRSISNRAGETDKAGWRMEGAVKNLCVGIERLVNEML